VHALFAGGLTGPFQGRSGRASDKKPRCNTACNFTITVS